MNNVFPIILRKGFTLLLTEQNLYMQRVLNHVILLFNALF